jgi:(2Fe-2S) ferredoxin
MTDGPLFYPTRAHLLLCTGPRCARAGSAAVFRDGWEELERRSLAYYKRGGSIRLTEAGCLGVCSHGPTLVAYHGDPRGGLAEAWYVGVGKTELVEIAEALHDGQEPPERGRFGPR